MYTSQSKVFMFDHTLQSITQFCLSDIISKNNLLCFPLQVILRVLIAPISQAVFVKDHIATFVTFEPAVRLHIVVQAVPVNVL
jgi:hypothetical protein